MGKKGVCLADPLSDLFTRLRNGQNARRVSIRTPYSRLLLSVLTVLLERGYLRGVRVIPPESPKAPQYNTMEVFLKYDPLGKGAIKSIARVSKPSRRVYTPIDKLPRASSGLGCFILSTPKGVLHCAEARRLRVGGELLGEVL